MLFILFDKYSHFRHNIALLYIQVDFAYSQINDSELTIRVRLAGTIIAKVLAL